MAKKADTGEGQLSLDTISLSDDRIFNLIGQLEDNDDARAGSDYPGLLKERRELIEELKPLLSIEADGKYEFVVRKAKGDGAQKRLRVSVATTEAHEVDGGERMRFTAVRE